MAMCSRGSLAVLALLGTVMACFGQAKDKNGLDPKGPRPAAADFKELLRGWQGGQASGDPDAARLITSDIDNFWRAYDKATPKGLAEALEREYFQAGTPGLR